MSEAAARGTDTRARIQQVAVELFAEQGYEKTSLREIAERLAVTKAALYYHFKSKEDIVASLVEDYFGQVDALIGWARAQPGSAGTRAEILRRYVSIVAEGDEVFRMLHQNQAAGSIDEDPVQRILIDSEAAADGIREAAGAHCQGLVLDRDARAQSPAAGQDLPAGDCSAGRGSEGRLRLRGGQHREQAEHDLAGNRSLTFAARYGAANVRERFFRNTEAHDLGTTPHLAS